MRPAPGRGKFVQQWYSPVAVALFVAVTALAVVAVVDLQFVVAQLLVFLFGREKPSFFHRFQGWDPLKKQYIFRSVP